MHLNFLSSGFFFAVFRPITFCPVTTKLKPCRNDSMMVVFIQTEMAPCCMIVASLTVMAICSMRARKSRKVANASQLIKPGPQRVSRHSFQVEPSLS